MKLRRTVVLSCLLATAVAGAAGFGVGVFHARRATAATVVAQAPTIGVDPRVVAEVKAQLVNEMGLTSVSMLRDRRSSFVELYSYDALGKTHYGTAGYLGNGYFITVKHAVVALRDEDERSSNRRITSVKVVYKGKEIA